jgi:hypothetical protein
MKKAFIWSVPLCALVTVLALAMPGTATATGLASPSAYPTFPGRLYGVMAVSASDVWAVGLSPGGSLIEHWDGKTWTRVPSPNPAGSSDTVLQAVTAVSSGNVWAVGYATIGGYSKTLAMHWDGRHWTIVPSPTSLGNGSFQDVAASWTNNIWAVGITSPTPSGPHFQSLIEHWNSTTQRWKAIPSPSPPSDYLNDLWSVSSISRDDIWAVGTTDYGSTLIAHWNGTSWS